MATFFHHALQTELLGESHGIKAIQHTHANGDKQQRKHISSEKNGSADGRSAVFSRV
jgi:hypothetical protein